jgi:hypothetical protein
MYVCTHIYEYREVRSLLSSKTDLAGGNLRSFTDELGITYPLGVITGGVLNNRPRTVGEAHTCVGKVIDKGSGDQFKSYTSPR